MSRIALAAAVVAILAIGAVAAWMRLGGDESAPTATEVGREIVRGRFSLIDETGRAVTEADYDGAWRLVFFGYTYCPDVCPTTLNTIAGVLARLGADAARVKPLFITVDPARDTPEVLAEYVAAFDRRITGLTGTAEQIAAAARAFGVYYAKVGNEAGGDDAPSGDYLMDHSAFIYLMDPKGRYLAAFSHDDAVDKIVAGIRRYW